jgi:hypothetical protein
MAEITEWADELPPNCPPADAVEPDYSPFYRLVGNTPPRDEDFWSQRKLYPLKKFHTTECIARSCSLISTIERCAELLKLPTQQSKKIIKLILPPQSGLIKKTGGNVAHYSWWRAKNFNPIPACVEVAV